MIREFRIIKLDDAGTPVHGLPERYGRPACPLPPVRGMRRAFPWDR